MKSQSWTDLTRTKEFGTQCRGNCKLQSDTLPYFFVFLHFANSSSFAVIRLALIVYISANRLTQYFTTIIDTIHTTIYKVPKLWLTNVQFYLRRGFMIDGTNVKK